MAALANPRYRTTVRALPNGGACVPVPFDPDATWGVKERHPIAGTIDGAGVRGTILHEPTGWSFQVGPAWLRDCSVRPGVEVEVMISPEGPQRVDLAPDVAAALGENPAAGAFFDTLAQFYRKAYLRWIDATKRQPNERAVRIAEVVGLLADGIKARPKL